MTVCLIESSVKTVIQPMELLTTSSVSKVIQLMELQTGKLCSTLVSREQSYWHGFLCVYIMCIPYLPEYKSHWSISCTPSISNVK